MGSPAKKYQSKITGMRRKFVSVENEKTRKRLKFEELRKTIKPKEDGDGRQIPGGEKRPG